MQCRKVGQAFWFALDRSTETSRAPLAGVVVCLAAVWCAVRPAAAVVVFKRGQTQPVTGYLDLETDTSVTLRQPLADGQSREVTIAKAEIDDLLHSVDPARLSALDPSRSQEYREYADELAEKKLDPEARDAAIRLYAIAAHLASSARPPGDAKGALLGLISLARSPEEEARFRAAAYLADPRHDAAILRPLSVATSAGIGRSDPQARAKLLEAVRHARQGKGDVAARLVQRPEIRAELEAARAILSPDEFAAICRTKEPARAELAKLLRLELALEAASLPKLPPTNARQAATAWSQTLKQPQAALRPVDIEHLTEFNPRKSLFRGGKWVEP
jgi:hypothetical protein